MKTESSELVVEGEKKRDTDSEGKECFRTILFEI